jgi:dipeptidyl aminopeptidase/acylaminoacyl peptidase
MPLAGTEPPRELARGGEFIRPLFRLRSFPAMRAGWAQVITPKWSPDGRRIAFLRQVAGDVEVWAVDAVGAEEPRRLTDLPDEVEDFAWSADGAAIVTTTRPGLRTQTEAIDREARQGFVYDERFAPQFASRPIPRGPMELHYTHVDIATRLGSTASTSEAALLDAAAAPGHPAGMRAYAKAANGTTAWAVAKDTQDAFSPSELVVERRDGTRTTCSVRLCEGAQHMWWSSDGRDLFALRRGDWTHGTTSLLRWHLGEALPREVLTTEDALVGCQMAGDELVCAREGSVQPRRLVALSPKNGVERVIHDPNPQFARLKLGHVTRLRFRNAFGVDSFADLVLPPSHKPGEKHPLVVVQYVSQGFLRGGTGDEVPIQVLAAKGIAVLSFQRPNLPASMLGARTTDAYTANAGKDWIDRRNVQSSLERAVELAVATGSVDPHRMGISGFSDGTSTTQWALVNSSLFKVAAMGVCCEDMYAYLVQAGIEFEGLMRTKGYRLLEPGAQEWWAPISLIQNVDRIDAPILVQTGDSEYTTGLDTAAAFRRRGKPYELIVLEEEGHFKWQPAHRLAIYNRYVEWFEFWLMHRMNCSPERSAQYARWKAMRGAPGDLACETIG